MRRREITHASVTETTLVGWRAKIVGGFRTGAVVVACTSGGTHLRVVFNHSKKHGIIHDNLKLSCTHGCKLTKHDVLGNASAVVKLTIASSIQQDLHSLFEGTTHQCTGIVAVDSVTCNSHEETALAHDVDEDGHVSVIDIGTVEGKHSVQLAQQTLTCSFDTENSKNLDKRVGIRVLGIYAFNGKHFGQGDTISIKNPFLATLVVLVEEEGVIGESNEPSIFSDEGSVNATYTT